MARLAAVVAGLGIVASGVAAFVLFRSPSVQVATESRQESPPAAVTAAAPTASPASADIDALLAACPLVDRATAQRLRESPTVAALGQDEFTLVALSMGDQGLATVGKDKSAEIGQAFGRIFSTMSADQRAAFGDAVAELRSGKQPAPGVAAAALAALRAGALAMSTEQQDRLRDLYSAAIQSGVAHQREAGERTRTAVVFPSAPPRSTGRASGVDSRRGMSDPTPAVAAASGTPPTPAPLARPRRSAEDWQRLIDAARERVKRAERELEVAERPLPADAPVASAGVSVPSIVVIRGATRERPYVNMAGRSAIELRDQARAAEQAAQARATQSRAVREQMREQAIARARRTLEEARAALSKLEDDARADR